VVTSLLVLEGDGGVREFIGGWSDWRAWRDARDAERRRESAARTAAAEVRREPGQPASPSRRRLSFNEQREFDALPARIEQLEARKTELDVLVADGAFYARPHAEVRETLTLLRSLEEEIEAAYSRWQELESRR
jgi:ATP-binding cassette subfamily F protein uup